MRGLCRVALSLFLLLALVAGCDKGADKAERDGRIRVVTTLFPLYDFTRNIGRDRVQVDLLLPPGMEAHSFEPKPDDIMKVNKADLFVYTNRYMEPWAGDIISGIDRRKTLVVDTSRGARLLKSTGGHDHGDGERGRHGAGGIDPHIWLDFDNARIMVDDIVAGLVARDPANRDFYLKNGEEYKARLAGLDNDYRRGLAHCGKRVFLHGGHYAFGYLANRYGLRYESAYALSADSEPTAEKIMSLIRQVRENGLRHIFTEELVEPRVAETIAKETGATILKLHGAHNIGRDDLAGGATFLSLMELNLKNLRTGLLCTEK